MLDELLNVDVPIVDVGNDTIDDFAQVVGRNFGGHPNGNTVGAVDEEVGDGGRQDGIEGRSGRSLDR